MTMNLRFLQAAAIVVSLFGCDNAARSPVGSAARFDASFVQAFMGNCVQGFAGDSKIEAASTAMRWKRITDPAVLEMIGPANGGSDWKAWRFKSSGKVFMLATGQNEVDGRLARFCVLISEPTDIDATRDALVKLLRAKRQHASEEAGQRYEVHQFEFDGRMMLLNFIDGVPMGMKMLNASVVISPHL
jgi:hypothetical protein